MSDAPRPDRVRALDAASEADRDAKIEQLLLVGLDHYFAAQYDQAINVWTRALFLDRSHPRARAYIERARSALAERQRKSEELLHTGVAAFERGEGDEARRLLNAAIDGGAPQDEARAVLDRLDRLGATGAGSPAPRRGGRRRPVRQIAAGPSRPIAGRLALAVVLLAGLAAGGYAAFTHRHLDWRSWLAFPTAPPVATMVARDTELPLPRRGEIALARARSFATGGRLRDALASLDLVRPTDPEKSEADRLRSDIQRQLMSLAAGAPVADPAKSGQPIP